MREIKFRAWHKKYKKMYRVQDLHMAHLMNGGIWATIDGRDPIKDKDIYIQIQPKDIEVMQYVGLKDIEVMQYVGLKDIEGREIYEGDIVEGHADGLGKIVWQGACWTYEFIDSNTVGLDEICLWFGNNAIVIGNIYENPDLLPTSQEQI